MSVAVSQRVTVDDFSHAFTVYPSMSGSLAEAAALAALAPGARLIAPRVTSEDGMATCAIAEGDPA